MTTPAVTTKQIYIAVDTSIYLTRGGLPAGPRPSVSAITPGIYLLEERTLHDAHPYPNTSYVYYVKEYPTVRTHNGIEYDGWHVWEEHLRNP